MARGKRKRDWKLEYRQRNAKAQREGYRSYGEKRYKKEQAQKRARVSAGVRVSRTRLEQDAVDQYRRYFGTAADIDNVERRMGGLSDTELRILTRLRKSDIEDLARQPPEENEYENPYWYH